MAFGMHHDSDEGIGRRMSALSINPALTPVDEVWYGQSDSDSVVQQQPQRFISVKPAKALLQKSAANVVDDPPCYDDVAMQPQQQLQQPSHQQPIMIQPGAIIQQSQEPQKENPMQLNHQKSSDCPIGLEFLLGLDTVHVQQQKIKSPTSKEMFNKYLIMNSKGEHMFYAIESDDPVPRRVVRLEWSRRTFHYKIMDNQNKHVFSVRRKQYITPECVVETLSGETIGHINNSFGFCKSEIAISNEKKGLVFTLPGPCCCEGFCDGTRCFESREYPIHSSHSWSQLGTIHRKFSGYSQEGHANPDVYEIMFPMDLDVRMKAVLIGTALFVDVLELKRK